jgi:predicted acyltransferase (DUF342 family)
MPILNSFNPGVAVNTGINTITIPGHGLVNAQGVVYSNGNGSSIGGLVNGYKYYVIFVDSLTIKLANTEVEARANTSIDLLSTGSGTTHLLTTTTEYPNSAAYYDFFRKFRFIGTGIVDPEGYTIEADNVRDTLTIIGGTNIEFTQPQSGVNDTITINGPDYDLVSPTGVTNGAVVRLENVGVEYHDLKLTSFRGIRIERVATNEIEFESFGVTETDTLHTVSSRGNLTSNNLVMNNLLVGKIQSTPGIDGFINVSVSSGDAYNGDGTLDNPLIFSPDESQRTDAAKTVTLNFSAPSPGTFNYVAVYRSSAVLLSGYVRLERENPSTLVWETLDYTAGTLARTSYDIENIYAELDAGPVNYRITFDWTGNTEFVNYRIRLTYEVEPIAGNEIILTDTDTEVLTLGTSNGTVNLRGTIGVVETLNFDGLKIFENNIDGNVSNADINLRPNGTGDLVVTADTDILGDLIVRGGDITTDKTTFNLLNTTATTVNAFGAANTAVIATNASSIQLGNFTLNGSVIDTDDSSGIIFVPVVTLNSDLNVENDIRVTQDVFVSGNTQITQDLSVSGNTQITQDLSVSGNTQLTQDLSVSGNTQLTQDLLINGSLTVGGGITGNSTLTVDSNAVFNADVQIRGGDLTTNQTTFNLLNTTATTVNAFGAATVINVGALTGTTTVNNNLTVTGDLLVNGTTTTLNTATLDVEDLNITVAKGAINAAAANGAGLTVDGANATLLYASSNDSWNFNKLLTATSLQNTPIGTTTRAAGNFTSLEANGNVVLGDADTDTITVGGSFVTGTTLKSAKVATNTLALAAYDVDGTAYSNLITLTASNTPTLTLTSIGVGSLDNIDIGTTTRGSGKFTTLDANGNTIIGSDSADTATVNATITSNLIFTDNTYDIGATGATRPRSLFLSQNATLGGNLQVDGNTTIGNADTDTITVGGSFVTGTALRTAKTATNTLSLAAYDVDGTAYTNLITLTAGNTPSLALTSTGTGSIDNMTVGGSTAAAGTFTNLTASGLTTLAEITETLNTKTAATGVVTHDFSTGAIWYHSSISANFTVNLTNVPTTNDRIITVSLVLNQGATGRLPSAFQIDGVAQTIRWQNNVTPTPNINIIEIATFSLVRTGSTWFVLGQLAPFA